MLSIPCEDRYGVLTITPQKHKDETLRVLVDIVDAAARRHPNVLLFEDAHWADPTTLEVLDQLIDRVRTIPLLIVLTHRPAFQVRWSAHGHVTALNLSKLTRAQSTAIIVKLVGGKTLPSELLAQILAKTDGVPLFVEELTKAILESGELRAVDDHYEYVGISKTIILPATLRDSLMARLDRSPAAKEIAQMGSAIGREFSYALLAAVTQKPTFELDAALGQLTDSGLAFRRGSPPVSTYTFKHALVQDAAYDPLLNSARQVLHATIARVLETDFPQTAETQPEFLAHHLTAAGQAEAAIPFWHKAGTLAMKRQALQEAVAHLNQGMEVLSTLPPSRARDDQEVDLRTPLGMAWLAHKGWSAPEVWTSLHPALDLGKSLGRYDALLPIYYGLWSDVVAKGNIAESLAWADEMLTTADAAGDSDLLVVAHQATCVSHFWSGDLIQSRAHGDQVVALYREEQHRHLVDLMNIDPTSMVAAYRSPGAWMLGYPDQARQICELSVAAARRRHHPFDLGYVLSFGSWVLECRGESALLLTHAEEAEVLGRVHHLSVISEVLAQIIKGIVLVRLERIDEGVSCLRDTLKLWRAKGIELGVPYWRAVLAEGVAASGDFKGGLRLIEESLIQSAGAGWEERSHLAEILRLKGWMLSLQGDVDGAEQNYRASLVRAREQQAKSWELRTATSLARWWQSQGKVNEARELLAPIYDWFTEGFDTKDLKEAKALLAILSP